MVLELHYERHSRGLETTFDDLLDICGIEYPVQREGRIIFVGLATILIPVRVLQDHSVQWHVIPSSSLSRMRDDCPETEEMRSVFTASFLRHGFSSKTETEEQPVNDDPFSDKSLSVLVGHLR